VTAAIPHRDDVAELTSELLDMYGPLCLYLIPLCTPRPHQHNREDCTAAGKRPLPHQWQRLPTLRRSRGVTPERVAREMAQHILRGGNIGLVIPDGWIVLDADTPEADALLASMLDLRQGTASGAHYPVLGTAPNSVRVEIESGIHVDVRGTGGQIVCSPSVHATGVLYEWDAMLPRNVDDLPELPERWAQKIMQRPAPSPASVQRGTKVPEGGRNALLYGHARSMLARGLSAEAVAAAIRIENAVRCAPPLDDGEVARMLRHAATQPHRSDFGGGR
jgi:hypothetical protein